MIDRGLLVTVGITLAAIALLDRRLRRRPVAKEPILAMASTPLMAGLAVARLAAVALDDLATLGRPFDLLLIRGGMEYWPGVAAAAAVVWMVSRREHISGWERLAELAPFALWAYGAYEAACVVRDGCFGPSSPWGLRPGGLGDRQIPVGLLVGVALTGGAAMLWRRAHRLGATGVVVAGVGAVAAVRSASGFALPKVTAGLTRPHRESLAVLAATALVGAGMAARRLITGAARSGPECLDASPTTPSAPGASASSPGDPSVDNPIPDSL